MKITELIEQLTKTLAEHGDHEVLMHYTYPDNSSPYGPSDDIEADVEIDRVDIYEWCYGKTDVYLVNENHYPKGAE